MRMRIRADDAMIVMITGTSSSFTRMPSQRQLPGPGQHDCFSWTRHCRSFTCKKSAPAHGCMMKQPQLPNVALGTWRFGTSKRMPSNLLSLSLDLESFTSYSHNNHPKLKHLTSRSSGYAEKGSLPRFLRSLARVLPQRVHEFTPQGLCARGSHLVEFRIRAAELENTVEP